MNAKNHIGLKGDVAIKYNGQEYLFNGVKYYYSLTGDVDYRPARVNCEFGESDPEEIGDGEWVFDDESEEIDGFDSITKNGADISDDEWYELDEHHEEIENLLIKNFDESNAKVIFDDIVYEK